MFYSVIVPIYNSEKTLKRCIDSIINQSFSYFELLLIDDGSTDRSGEICDSYTGDNRVHVYHKSNGGVSVARNVGINNAQGTYLVFVDADDYIEVDYLLHLKDYCSKGVLVIGGYTVKNEQLSVIRKRHHEYATASTSDQKAIVDHYVKMDFDCVWGKVFCKEDILYHQVCFDETMNYGEDSKFNVDMLQNLSEIRFVPFEEYCHIKYQSETLSTFKSYNDAIDRIETESSKVYSSLYLIIGSFADICVLKKAGEKYAYIFLDAISKQPNDIESVCYFYKQYWFRKVLNNSDVYFAKESKKFRWLLKTKSATLMSLYLSLRK